MELYNHNNGSGIFIQVGSGAGDLDTRVNCRDGFTEFVKKLPRERIKKLILVEPNPLNIPKLKECWKDYPESVIYQVGIVPGSFKKNSIELFYCPQDAPHYQVASINKDHIYKHYGINCELNSFQIQVRKLEDLIKEITNEEIELLALDIEGIDAEVILDLDFNNIKIKHLSFEHLHLGKDAINVITHLNNNHFYFLGNGLDVNGYDHLYVRRIIKNNTKRNIYQISMFNNELDLLELALEQSYNYIDKFILVESTKTHSGENKESSFLKNKDRFDKYKDKIIHFICEYDSDLFESYKNTIRDIYGPNDYVLQTSWIRENFQRDYPVLYGEINFNDEDLILILDIDEIININSLFEFINSEQSIQRPYRLEMDFMHYYLNTHLYFKESNVGKKWYYPALVKYSDLKKYHNSLSTVRVRFYSEENIIKNAGWHFGYLMDVENIYKKIKIFAHHEEDIIKNINKSDISKCISDLNVFYDKSEVVKLKEFPFELLPETIKNNKEKWEKYFWQKKDLLIIGCYPNSKNNEDILIECINSLSDNFDIVLVSHFPIHEKIQKLVKYVIYDKDNQHADLGSLLIWQKNNNFNYQVHVKNKKDYAYSVLKNIFNGVNLLKNKYESFYYIDYDCIIHSNDIEKFKNLKNKNASFFVREDGFLHTLCFYSNINFFIKNVPEFENISSYLNFCKSEVKDKYPVLEHFLYSVFLKNNVLQDINLIKDHPINFFTNSQIDIRSVSLNDYGVDVPVYIVSLKNENRLFLIYLGNKLNKFTTNKQLKIYVDDMHLCDLDVGEYFYWSEIFANNENFSISVNDKKQFFNKTDLFNDKLNYIEFINK